MHILSTAAALLAACVSTAGQPGSAAIYSSAVAAYRAGDYPAAAQALATLRPADIRKQVETAAGAATRDSGDAAKARLEAAAMLHTEYAMLADIDAGAAAFHIDLAHLLLTFDRQLAERAAGGSAAPDTGEAQRAREFLPRWCALASSVLLLHGLNRNARACIDEVLRVLPDDPEMLFSRGVVAEFEGVWSPPETVDPHSDLKRSMPDADATGFDPRYRERVWGPAAEAYRRALKVDPGNHEVRLHLGYVLAALAKDAESQALLEAARDQASDPYVVYLANLFLGRRLEALGDRDGAAQDYERARALLPGGQSAILALSVLEDRRGNTARARELVATFMGTPQDRRVADPWWAYHTSRVPPAAWQWLRSRVRQ